MDADKIRNKGSCLGTDIDQGVISSKMHFLYDPKGSTNFGYRHRSPIRPIIQHVFIPNINKVVHKLIGW